MALDKKIAAEVLEDFLEFCSFVHATSPRLIHDNAALDAMWTEYGRRLDDARVAARTEDRHVEMMRIARRLAWCDGVVQNATIVDHTVKGDARAERVAEQLLGIPAPDKPDPQ